MNNPNTLNITRYIGEKKQELLDIIDTEGRILLVANPGTGKTFFATELMKLQKMKGNRFIFATFLTAIPKQLYDEFKFDLVCSASEQEWKERTEFSDPDDELLEDDELVIGTTLHQLIRFIKQLTKDDVIVIDEAHQLVQLSHKFQISVLRDELMVTPAKILLMTGTPFEKEEERLNLTVVNVVEDNPRVDKLIYLPITSNLKDKTSDLDLAATLIQWYLYQEDGEDEDGNTLVKADTKKILIYNNSSRIDNQALSETLYKEYDFRFDNINAERKESAEYKYLIKEQRIRDEANGIITTSVIKEGINIRNQDVDIIIVLGHLTTKDEKQIAKRIRGDKVLEVYRIFNEPSESQIDKVEFEIDLINFLLQSFSNHPDKLKRRLKRLARCGEILRNAAILDKNVYTIDEVKAQDILEQLNAQKLTKDEFLQLEPYNDLKPYDGFDYLEEKYGFFLPDHDTIGDFTDQIEADKEKVRKERLDELKTIIQTLFGNSNNLELAIKLLKGDLLNYNNVGYLLGKIHYFAMRGIKRSGYVNSDIKDDPLDGMDGKEMEEHMLSVVKTFSSKFHKEMIAVVKILLFLTRNTNDYSSVLPILNEAIPLDKLEWTAKRFVLADKLDDIKNKLDTDARRGSKEERSAITEEDDLIRFHIMREIESQLKKYKYVYRPLLEKFVQTKYGDSQYLKSLRLHVDEELTLYIHAMGITEGNISWKKSAQNQTRFDKLWSDAGKSGTPPIRKGVKVYSCELSTPKELIKDYFENI